MSIALRSIEILPIVLAHAGMKGVFQLLFEVSESPPKNENNPFRSYFRSEERRVGKEWRSRGVAWPDKERNGSREARRWRRARVTAQSGRLGVITEGQSEA